MRCDQIAGFKRRQFIASVCGVSRAHSQTERLVIDSEDLEFIGLAPYSPMCNPIDGCFSLLKATIKAHLAMNAHEMFNPPYGEMTERRICLLKRAADRGMSFIDLRLMNKMARH
ncbi:hypothetical protein PHMEG_0004340 [Phytophthora megakarya]|uniref:Tc1-like transposase DDE domain-containing protein n=1 Tax=Phytophthora megakarya TaxID=4795 RepID=A0A225WVN3_9STRA|nr:hypothetical protein PHMEG_0004340 [Phytophthora megakarya]